MNLWLLESLLITAYAKMCPLVLNCEGRVGFYYNNLNKTFCGKIVIKMNIIEKILRRRKGKKDEF